MTTIKLFNIFFIFICSITFGQSKMFWNTIDMPLNMLINKFDSPTGIEYQENGEYWFAYDYGDKKIVYVVNKAIVISALYLEQVKNYNDAKSYFIKWNSLLIKDGFKESKTESKFFEKIKNNIQIQAKLIENFNSFLIAIQVNKHK